MFAAQELATAAQFNIALVVVVFNNRSYGNVLRDQQTQFGGRIVGAELVNPDFIAFADSFGVASARVRKADALKIALERALSANVPTLIEVVIESGTERSPWPLIYMSSRPSSLTL